MTEIEKIALIMTIADEVEDIVKGKSTSGAKAIARRLRRNEEKVKAASLIA